MENQPVKKGKMGCGTVIAILIITLILVLLGINGAVGYYYEHCAGEDIDLFECILKRTQEPETDGVAAIGTYTYKDYSADLTLYIPLEGGKVTGKIEGVCDGWAKGNFDGRDGGKISGTMGGTCDPFFVKVPGTGRFDGKVDKNNKKVILNITGKGGGIEKSDSMTLTYQ